MPSAIYDSVKQSVAEYGQIMKKNEKTEDRFIFRWKLITLALSIVFIVCLGIFSQLLRSINELPDVNVDKSFITPMLKQLSPQATPTVRQVQNLIKGISFNAESKGNYYQWNRATLLASYDVTTLANLNVANLQQQLQGYNHLVFVIASTSNIALYKFGLYASHEYTNSPQAVFDNPDTRYSSFFNLDNPITYPYSNANCTVFFSTPTTLTLFEALTIQTLDTGTTTYTLNITPGKEDCYGFDPYVTLGKLINIDLTVHPVPIILGSLQVYSLYLDEGI